MLRIALVVLALFAVPAHASEEQIHHWKTATLSADTDLFGTVEVKATADAGGNVKTLAVTAKGKTIVVPEAWLKTLPSLPLASIQIRTERGYDPQPWLYVFFQTPSTPQIQTHISFQGGKLVQASITKLNAKGATTEFKKAP
ncbi:MAG TPA: hypothetical protein VFQ53_43570 [Kofleriaceae bacterium]|nr:hypothetical protein [Kofleriaceae bacterium]